VLGPALQRRIDLGSRHTHTLGQPDGLGGCVLEQRLERQELGLAPDLERLALLGGDRRPGPSMLPVPASAIRSDAQPGHPLPEEELLALLRLRVADR
jgi:hypothetical protein